MGEPIFVVETGLKAVRKSASRSVVKNKPPLQVNCEKTSVIGLSATNTR